MRLHHALLPLLCTVASLAQAAEYASVTSPNGQLKVTLELVDGKPAYSAEWRGKPLVELSSCGLSLEGQESTLWDGRGLKGGRISDYRTPIVGKRGASERSLTMSRCSAIYPVLLSDTKPAILCVFDIRAYDNGFAIRYRILSKPKDANQSVTEQTEFRFAGDPTLWSYRKEQAPAGPTKLAAAKGKLSPPVLIQFSDDRYAAVHEADLRDSAWLELKASPGILTVDGKRYPVKADWQTPWRVVMVGESLGELVDSDLIANLNPKADPDEFAWVKPGVALWDWRSWGYVAPDGFKFGLNLESWKRFIDFAAEHEIPYVLLDANWYGPEMKKSSNPFTGGLAADVRKAIDYGKRRNVGLILYLNDVAGREYGIEKILQEWSSWGAAGIKYGFMRAQTPEEKVAWTRKIVRLCAENHLLVNFHDGPVPPAGDEASYPNWATREFCHAQSDAKRTFTPTTFLMQMAVNQLAGPIDMNNGMFDLNKSVAERPRVFVEVPATITAEAARTLIVYSGLTVIPDATPVYARHPELFRFISAQKMRWTESRTLAFELGQYISVMRQTEDNYLVGSATNEEGRTLEISLDFLPQGKKYEALICEDAPDAHFETNREAYRTRIIDVDSTTTVSAKLAPGGGHCLLITPAK